MKNLKNKKFLLTCGPTWIPIDDTRIISNISTGALGEIIAKDLIKAKANVTLLEGPVPQPINPKSVHKVYKFTYYDEYVKLLKKELKNKYDVIIHAAAISDYKLKKPFTSKLSSKLKKLTLELTPTIKIINTIKKQSPDTFLVGFKLTSSIDQKMIELKTDTLFKKAKCDLIIANSIKNEKYQGFIVTPTYKILAKERSRKGISKKLISILNSKL